METSEEYIQEYYKDNAKKLRSVVDKIIKKFGNITDREHFYSLANEVFVYDILKSYDGKNNFDMFVYSVLRRKIMSEITHINRDRRMPYLRDSNGEKVKDSEGRYIRLLSISLDEITQSVDDDSEYFNDVMKADFNLEDYVTNKFNEGASIQKYLNRLSNRQKKIVRLLENGYKATEIKKILHISEREYRDDLLNIRSYENISLLFNGR